MASRGHRMLNLALSTVVDSQNIRDDNNVTSRQDLNLQNEDSVSVLPERDTNIQPMETMNPSTSRALNEGDICLAEVGLSEKSLKRRARNQIPVGTYRKLHRGDDSEESDTLFSDCSSDEYQPNYNDYDGSDVEYVDNKQKKRKLQKKVFQQPENEIRVETGNNGVFNNQNNTVQNGEQYLVVTDENHPNNVELQGIPNLQAIQRKKKKFSPKLKVTKKRQRNPKEWLKVKRMINRERGEAYMNCKGELKPAKSVFTGALCPDKCRLKCSEAFTMEEREQVFTSYYKLYINAKNCLLFNAINQSMPCRKRTGAIKNKTATYKYSVSVGGKQTTVCKRAFVKLYSISTKKVELIQASIKTGLGAPAPDRRGKHNSRPNKTPEDVAAYIIQHISSFPAEESHYSRNKNIHKKYLSPLLSIPVMHKLYLEKCTIDQVEERFKIKECMYRFYFNNEFNLSFGQPKSDTCSTCDAGTADEEHFENYKYAFEAQKADREIAISTTNTVYITLDLQQTMPLPKLSTSKAFYLRQMWFYNLGIHIIAKDINKAICCTWTENQAGKGSNEIVSSLLRAIEVDDLLKQKDHLILWTDSCSGQNKNFLWYALTNTLWEQDSLRQ